MQKLLSKDMLDHISIFNASANRKRNPAVSFAALFTGTAVHFTLGDAFQWAQFCNAEASCGLN